MITMSELSQLIQGDISILQVIPIFISGVLYLGPESAMPLATILAAIIGFLLLFWRLILKVVKKPFKFFYYKITGAKSDDSDFSEKKEDSQEDIQRQ